MSMRRNIKKGLALQLEEKLAAVKASGIFEFGNPTHCGPGKSGGRFTDKEGTSCESGISPTSTKAEGASIGAEDKIPQGPFPPSEYDEKKGKPIPGTQAWLHAHGISPAVWKDRPYVRFEEGDSFDSLDPEIQKLYENEPEAKRQLLNMMGQTGGLIMVRKTVPGAEGVVPQSRPDKPVVTDKGKRAFRETALKNATARLEQMQALDGPGLVALQEKRVEKAKTALETAKTIDREGFLSYANGRVAETSAALEAAKEGIPRKGKNIDRKALAADPALLDKATALETAEKNATRAQKTLADTEKKANFNFGDPAKDTPEAIAEKTAKYREVETNNATKLLARQSKKLDKINGMDEEGKKAQIAQEIETATGIQKSAQNAFDKTAAKYLFPPNPAALRDAIDSGQILGKAGRVNVHGEENLKNLLNTDPAKGGNGRVYLAMEGNIKEDSLLAAVKNEAEVGSAVISVPSVTLWRHKEMLEVAQKYLGNGREVVLIPDADGVNNPRVRNEARAMQALLESVGAKVKVAPPPIPLDKNGKPIPDPEHPSKVQQFGTTIPGSPKGTHEELKGVDDYLGLGAETPPHPQTGERAKGTLGNLAVQRREVPPIDLKGDIISAAGAKNAENALRAISLIAGSKEVKAGDGSGTKVRVAAAQIGPTMLAAAMGKMGDRKAAYRSVEVLEKLGIVNVEHVYDQEAYARGIRQQNPNMTDSRINELVRAGVIDRPAFGDDDTRPIEYGSEEVPIISINTSYKGADGKVRDYSSRDDTPVPLGTHDRSPSRIRSLYSSGKTIEQIADILNVSNTTIEEAIK